MVVIGNCSGVQLYMPQTCIRYPRCGDSPPLPIPNIWTRMWLSCLRIGSHINAGGTYSDIPDRSEPLIMRCFRFPHFLSRRHYTWCITFCMSAASARSLRTVYLSRSRPAHEWNYTCVCRSLLLFRNSCLMRGVGSTTLVFQTFKPRGPVASHPIEIGGIHPMLPAAQTSLHLTDRSLLPPPAGS